MIQRWWRQLVWRADPDLRRLAAEAARLLGEDPYDRAPRDAAPGILRAALTRLEQLQRDQDDLRRRQQEQSAQRMAAVRRLIALRDWVLGQTPEHSTPERAALAAVNAKLADALRACGVTILEDQGPVDADRRQVVDTAPAPSEERRGHIAATVRPGYLLDGQLLRAQEVVVYIDRQEQSSRLSQNPH